MSPLARKYGTGWATPTLIRLTERYCVVYQTLTHPAQLSMSVTA